MTWYRIGLSRDEYEAGEVAIIQGAFQAIFIACNAPPGMALFGAWADDGHRYHVYFAPGALPHVEALVRAYSAIPENPSRPEALTLLFGDESGRHADVM